MMLIVKPSHRRGERFVGVSGFSRCERQRYDVVSVAEDLDPIGDTTEALLRKATGPAKMSKLCLGLLNTQVRYAADCLQSRGEDDGD